MMLFGAQRGSIFIVFDKLGSTFGVPAVILLVAAVFGNIEELLQNAVVLVIAFYMPIKKFADYFFTYYSIDAENFYVKSGILNKKTLEIPLDRITTVDFTQNIVFQLAGVYSIKVDNASNYGGNGSGVVIFALKEQDAVRVKNLLLAKKHEAGKDGLVARDGQGDAAGQEGNVQSGKQVWSFAGAEDGQCGKRSAWKSAGTEDGQPRYVEIEGAADFHDGEALGKSVKVPVKNILLMGALQSKGNAVAELISILAVFGSVINIAVGREMAVEEGLLEGILAIPGIGIAAIIVAAFFLISSVVGALFAFIKYYGFAITDGEKSIHLEYGLFTKKKHSLLKEKISGIEFVQSLPMRAAGIGYLNVMAVGYGSEVGDSEKAIMYPLIKEAAIEDFITGYLPRLEFSQNAAYKPLKSSIRYFFLSVRLIFALLLAVCFAAGDAAFGFIAKCPFDISWLWWILLMLLVLSVVSVIVEYRNTQISVGKDSISFTTGGFARVKTIIRSEMLESVSDSATVFKRKRGVINIKMGILAPLGDSVKVVRNMTFPAFDRVNEVLM